MAEDLHVVRAGLVSLLGDAFDIDVVAHVSSGDAVLPEALAHAPCRFAIRMSPSH